MAKDTTGSVIALHNSGTTEEILNIGYINPINNSFKCFRNNILFYYWKYKKNNKQRNINTKAKDELRGIEVRQYSNRRNQYTK